MNIDEKLALALDFTNAPTEIRERAIDFRSSFQELQKATTQADLWKQRRKDAQISYDESFEKLRDLVAQWNPAAASKLEETI